MAVHPWYVTDAPVVTIIAASYFAYAVPLGKTLIFLMAGLIFLGTFLVNYHGIVVSGKVQLAVNVSIVVLLLVAVIASLSSIRLESFTPFFPSGFVPVGVASALIFWSYLGYENVSNVAEKYKDPKSDFHRSIVLSVIIVAVLYLSGALATVGTRSYTAGGSIAPFAAILAYAIGVYGALGAGVLAIFIIFGTVNAYTTGMSRVVSAVASGGGLPANFGLIDTKTGVPHRCLALLSALSVSALAVSYFLDIDVETALLIPSGAAILVYIIGSASGIKLLGGGQNRLFPWVSLAISIAMAPFVGILLFFALAVVIVGTAYGKLHVSTKPIA